RLHTGQRASKGQASAEGENLLVTLPLPYNAGCRVLSFVPPLRDRLQIGSAKGGGSKSPQENFLPGRLPQRNSGPPRGVSPARGTVPHLRNSRARAVVLLRQLN